MFVRTPDSSSVFNKVVHSVVSDIVKRDKRDVIEWPGDAASTLYADFVNDSAAWRDSVGGAINTGTIAEMFAAMGAQGGATLDSSGLTPGETGAYVQPASLLNQTAMTFGVEAEGASSYISVPTLLMMRDQSAPSDSRFVLFYAASPEAIRARLDDPTGFIGNSTPAGNLDASTFRLSSSFDADEIQVSLNGGATATSTTARAMTAVLDTLYFGTVIDSNAWPAAIRVVEAWPTARSSNELETWSGA